MWRDGGSATGHVARQGIGNQVVYAAFNRQSNFTARRSVTQHHPDFAGGRIGHGEAPPARPSSDDSEHQHATDAMAEPSVYDLVVGAVERNPLLALGAVAALGAITVIALSPRRAPESNLRAIERQARRHAADLERSVRSGLNNSGLSRSFEDFSGALAQRLASADLSALAPIGQRASSLFDRAMDRVGSALK